MRLLFFVMALRGVSPLEWLSMPSFGLGSPGTAPEKPPPLDTNLQAKQEVKTSSGTAQSLKEAQDRCFGSPYPLVFGASVELPSVEVDQETLAKKRAVGFFGGTVKNPGQKNEGTAADRVLRTMAQGKGRSGRPKRGILSVELAPAPAATDADHSADADPRQAQRPAGRNASAAVARRRLLGKQDSLPLLSRCGRERVPRSLRPGEELVEECIEKPHKCRDWRAARRALQDTSGMASLRKRLSCLSVNRGCRSGLNMRRAPESGAQLTAGMQAAMIRDAPQDDIPRGYKTCAVVGNGPGLKMGGHKLGRIIDKHDAVFKYNLKNTGRRPGRLTDKQEDYHGTRSDFRIMNKKRSQAPLVEDWWGGLRPLNDTEYWLYWNYGSAVYFRGLKRINPRSYFVSPEYQTWLVQSYFALRSELYRLGMASSAKPLQCPVNISSGIHGLWLALQMCETVNLYGFSWNLNMLGDRTDGPSPRVSGSHSWDFDTTVLKMLALAGRINVCTQ
uniref:Beta-galactoside alpha--sialyltransferase 1 n=1 Tax=Tetraselmis sp. GSL018 TaxID=582737 RepID=A0A061R0F5_9CHLO